MRKGQAPSLLIRTVLRVLDGYLWKSNGHGGCFDGVNARNSLKRFRSRAEVGQVPNQQNVWKTLWKIGLSLGKKA